MAAALFCLSQILCHVCRQGVHCGYRSISPGLSPTRSKWVSVAQSGSQLFGTIVRPQRQKSAKSRKAFFFHTESHGLPFEVNPLIRTFIEAVRDGFLGREGTFTHCWHEGVMLTHPGGPCQSFRPNRDSPTRWGEQISDWRCKNANFRQYRAYLHTMQTRMQNLLQPAARPKNVRVCPAWRLARLQQLKPQTRTDDARVRLGHTQRETETFLAVNFTAETKPIKIMRSPLIVVTI